MALLELDDLTKRYGGIVAVDHVTMRIEAGEVRAVIGPNGAGKTSLFHLITGVVKATEGGVRFADDAAKHGDAALERLGLTHIADRQAGFLSHGDQRLLEVAMALAQQPRLLLLDEPTQGLSVEETAQAVDVLAALFSNGDLTVLLVEHDMEVVFRLAHKITVLHRGSVIADGDPQTVKADEGVQAAYLGGFA